jgi:serine/threonine protein kinase
MVCGRMRVYDLCELPGMPAGVGWSCGMSDSTEAAEAGGHHVPGSDYRAGDMISGRYRLLELIGEGGMGDVWLAEQREPVRRRVAVKLIRAGMDSERVLLRFEMERQALALMDHPGIARLYDGGLTEGGRPYFVMEYIRGVPLTEYCDREQLTVRERLRLFLSVCQAVQHAHQKGIVHRDLKPSNVMVCLYDGVAVTKVIDFGLAKALHQPVVEQSLPSLCQLPAGTLVYMSPEQADMIPADVDSRTDIYSLGIILYELLTGCTPLELECLQRAAFQEILRMIREVEPARPSVFLRRCDGLTALAACRGTVPAVLQNMIAGDLDWIVLKALEKDRNRRYETTLGLARDLECYLSDERVEATPPGQLYTLQKFGRRHRRWVTAGLIGAVAMLLAGSGLAWRWWQSWQGAERERQSLAALQRGLEHKETALRHLQLQRERVEQYLSDSIVAAVDDRQPDRRGILPRSLRSRDASEVALKYWASIPDDRERVQVLRGWLQDAESALALEKQCQQILLAAVGFSAERRRLALELLSERQRCEDCAPEVRAVSCLLSLMLQGTDVPAVAEAVQVLSRDADGIPGHLYQSLWKMLPELSVADRERAMTLLLNSGPVAVEGVPVRFPFSTGVFSTPYPQWEYSERSGLCSKYESIADYLLKRRITRLEPAMRHDAWWYWQSVMRDSQQQFSRAGSAVAPGRPIVRACWLLDELVFEIPEERLPDATADLLVLLELSAGGAKVADAACPATFRWMQQLVLRLPPAQLTELSGRLQQLLRLHRNEHVVTTVLPLLWGVLPQLSESYALELQSELAGLIVVSEDWSEFAHASLMWTLGQCAARADREDAENSLSELLALSGAEDRSVGMLAWAIHRLAPGLSSSTAGKLLTVLQRVPSVKKTQVSGSAVVGDFVFSHSTIYVVRAMISLAARLDSSTADDVVRQMLEQAQVSGRAIPVLWSEQELLAALVPRLSLSARQQLRAAVLSGAAGPAYQLDVLLPAELRQKRGVRDLTAMAFRMSTILSSDVDVPQDMTRQFDSGAIEAVLWQLAVCGDGSDDAQFLKDLRRLFGRPQEFGCAASLSARALEVLLRRSDAAGVLDTWEFLTGELRGAANSGGTPSAPAVEQSLATPAARLQWQLRYLAERHTASLLSLVAAELSPDDAWTCFCQLEELEQAVGPASGQAPWHHTLPDIFDALLRRISSDRRRTEISRARLLTGIQPTWQPGLLAADVVRSANELRLVRLLAAASVNEIDEPVAVWHRACEIQQSMAGMIDAVQTRYRTDPYLLAWPVRNTIDCAQLAARLTEDQVQLLWKSRADQPAPGLEHLIMRVGVMQREELARSLLAHLSQAGAGIETRHFELAAALGPHVSSGLRIQLAAAVSAVLSGRTGELVDVNSDIFSRLLWRPREAIKVLNQAGWSDTATPMLLRRLAELTRGGEQTTTAQDWVVQSIRDQFSVAGPLAVPALMHVLKADLQYASLLPQGESFGVEAEDWFSPVPQHSRGGAVMTPAFDTVWDALRWLEKNYSE